LTKAHSKVTNIDAAEISEVILRYAEDGLYREDGNTSCSLRLCRLQLNAMTASVYRVSKMMTCLHIKLRVYNRNKLLHAKYGV
jgi:hypothetical protein